ncbi:MAG: GNAT family N-acetyltransferase [Tissierellia bacterium]|nr:GNAT family N-acetyltransferase [Tissierellia bacterium]
MIVKMSNSFPFDIEGINIKDENIDLVVEGYTKENELIGAIVKYRNFYHPYCDEIYVYIVEKYRKLGFGSKLVNLISEKCLYPLKCSTFSNKKDSTGFLEKNGFIKKRSCWEYRVSKRSFIGNNTKNLKVQRFCELNEESKIRILEFVVLTYFENHVTISGANKDISIDDWIKVLTKDISDEDSFVYMENGKLFFMLNYLDSETEISVAYVGSNMEKASTVECLNEAINTLFNKYEYMVLEIDDVDETAMILKTLFDKKQEYSYDTYIKK